MAVNIQALLKAGKKVFLFFKPEVLDFTDPDFKFDIILWSALGELRIPTNKSNLLDVASMLSATVFEEGSLVIGWNLKNFFSYLFHHTNSDFEYKSQLIDLKLLEAFLGIHEKQPAAFAEVQTRLKAVVTAVNWSKAKEIYKKIHLPLLTKVIPALESESVVNILSGKVLHAYYEIEGQANGRLACQKALKECYNPHSILPEERKIFRPKMHDSVFIYADYMHMEVTMLQWLTQDDKLKELLEHSDFYAALFEIISGGKCDNEAKRSFCKSVFLPIIYGQSPRSLAEKLSLNQKTADKIFDILHRTFPVVFAWAQGHQEQASNVYEDAIGRTRVFEDREYRVRNFMVQAPAAIVCLEKLVQVSGVMAGLKANLIANIHDGYLFRSAKEQVHLAWSIIRPILESASEICPGLQLRAVCKIGPNLENMELI